MGPAPGININQSVAGDESIKANQTFNRDDDAPAAATISLTQGEQEAIDLHFSNSLPLRIFMIFLLVGANLGVAFVQNVYETHFVETGVGLGSRRALESVEVLTPVLVGLLIDMFGLYYIMVIIPMFTFLASLVAFILNE